MAKTKHSPVTEAILEMAEGLHRAGVMSDDNFHKITVRHLGKSALPTDVPISGEQIREIRERAHMSQGAFARHLHTSSSYVSKLERGEATASGPALALLNVIRRKGIEVLM
jgi:putative transcriptional regulator